MSEPTLFDPIDPHPKRATRYKLEVVDADTMTVLWDMLVTERPPEPVRRALLAADLVLRRPVVKGDPDRFLVYSELDPSSSIEAAREAHARRATKRSAVLMLLLHKNGGWVDRGTIRSVGGDSGDRRVRELRQDGWPIEIRQQTEGAAWACRMNIRGSVD